MVVSDGGSNPANRPTHGVLLATARYITCHAVLPVLCGVEQAESHLGLVHVVPPIPPEPSFPAPVVPAPKYDARGDDVGTRYIAVQHRKLCRLWAAARLIVDKMGR